MNIQFEGKTAIVTGAAHGFGRAIALAFAARGASVWACDVLGDELDETRQLCQDAGGNCQVKVVNVRNRDEVFSFVDEIIAADSTIHILVNNAGGVLGQVGRPLEEITEPEWDSIFEVNTRGAFYFAQAVAPSMKARKYGRIVNISSGAGLGVSLTGIQAYASAKSGADRLDKTVGARVGRVEHHRQQYRAGFCLVQSQFHQAV